MSSKDGPAPEQPPGPPALCIPGPGEKIVQDFQVLVQKVGGRPEVLLIGETLGGQDIHGMMASFVKDLFSATCQPIHPGEALKEPYGVPCTIGGRQCRLIFFLCRASCLHGKQAELRAVLSQVKRQLQNTPCALVGVIMQPTAGEAEAARAQLLRLLRGVFPKRPRAPGREKPSQKENTTSTALELEDIEVEAEIYDPGHPRGNLAIMKAACRASEALAQSRGSSWTMTLCKGLLGTACLVGALSIAWWYLCDDDMEIPLTRVPSFLSLFP